MSESTLRTPFPERAGAALKDGFLQEALTIATTKFIDLRFAKRFRVGNASVEPNIDLFNLLNANHVLLQNEQIGSTWGRPTRILTPRIIRFGVTARF